MQLPQTTQLFRFTRATAIETLYLFFTYLSFADTLKLA